MTKRLLQKFNKQTDTIKVIGDPSTEHHRNQIMKDIIDPIYSDSNNDCATESIESFMKSLEDQDFLQN